MMLKIGDLSDERFEDVLLKSIKNDFYYVLDYVSRDRRFEIRRVDMDRDDVPKRIRLYDQPSASKVGISFSIGSFFGKDRLLKMIEGLRGLPVEGLESLAVELAQEDFVYPESLEDVIDYFGGRVTKYFGYGTLAIDGRIVVDVEGYDELIIGRLYEGLRKFKREEMDHCYLCGDSSCELLNGGVKEPAWKFLSTTRTTNLASDKKAFLRCETCERRLMLGFYEMQSLVKYETFNGSTFERLIVPLTTDKRLWGQLKRLRKDHEGDLDYYMAVDRLMERYERRGVREFLYCRVLRNQRSYVVLTTEVIGLERLGRLRNVIGYRRFMDELGNSFVGYYPEGLIEDEHEYRWRYVDQVKRYWMGYGDRRVFDDVERFLKVDSGIFARFKYFDRYVGEGETALKDSIVCSREYALGSLMRIASSVQEKDMRRSVSSKEEGYGLVASLKRRFMGYPKDPERMFGEVMKVIDYRYRYLSSDDREQVAKWVEVYATGEFVGDSGYYYLGVYRKN